MPKVTQGSAPAAVLAIECHPAFAPHLDQTYLQHLAALVMAGEGGRAGEISLLITDDEGIRTLNKEYRGVDKATDVLSFLLLPRAGESFVTPPGEDAQLGDIVISYEHTLAQAQQYGHPARQELAELFVHGLLHILGYDHETEQDAQIMAEKAEHYVRQDPAASHVQV